MQQTDVVIVGAGQAGLAMSACLSRFGIDHVVLERGRVGERWRNERWDSLRLLTPNWQTRLPGYRYQGERPDGFMSMPEVAEFLDRYACVSRAPVVSETRVLALTPHLAGYSVRTDRDNYFAENVVIATGYCDVPRVPELSRGFSPDLFQLSAAAYKRPAQLARAGVLVVGASASGAQLALELARSGRRVALATGAHTRLPRTYRGRDIMAWLECAGILGEPVPQAVASRAYAPPSFQLMGSDHGQELDLDTLARAGVELCGHLAGVSGHTLTFADDLAELVARSEARLERVLSRIDAFIARAQIPAPPPERPPPLGVQAGPTRLDARVEGIESVVWATGYSRDYRWLQVPVLDAQGEIRQQQGMTGAPGLYTLGQRFQRTRKSNFIDGVADDARVLASHIARRLGAVSIEAA